MDTLNLIQAVFANYMLSLCLYINSTKHMCTSFETCFRGLQLCNDIKERSNIVPVFCIQINLLC